MKKKINENIKNFKTTLDDPVSDQSVAFEKKFKKTMNQNNLKLNEVDDTLTEAEQSLKKKIFSLAKMESLVFSDPKLSAVYDEMATNGEEKYGYHYNETIMNMIFNDYVLNSPKYIQKYKMAIPKEKKRRDKSGINKLKKAGEEKMKKNLTEETEEKTKVIFLINDKMENPDVFAYFPEENHDAIGKYKILYSHIGQHSACDPNYAKESRLATPEEYSDLKAELEGIGYNLDVISDVNETTSATSSGAFAPVMGFKKSVEETTTSASSGAYYTPAAWGSGDLKDAKGKSDAMRKPIWKGGTIIQESDYLTDSKGFEQYIQELENFDKIATVDQLKQMKNSGQKLTKEMIPQLAGEALYHVAIQFANRYLPMHWNDLPDINSMWDYIDENGGMTFDMLITAVKDAVNDRLSEEGFSLDDLNEEAKSKAQQRLFGMVKAYQKGKLKDGDVSNTVKKMAKNIKPDNVDDFASTKHDKLPEKIDEYLSLHDTVEYVSDRKDEKPFELNDIKWQFVNAKYPDGNIDIGVYRFGQDVVYDYKRWMEEFNINEQTINENPALMALGRAAAVGAGTAIGNKVADKYLNEHHLNNREEKINFIVKAQFQKLTPENDSEEAKIKFTNELNKHNDKIINELYLMYENELKKRGIDPLTINETESSMIDNNSTTMANKNNPTGEIGTGNVPTGISNMNEGIEELNKLNDELNAFAIHHEKLQKLDEERKTPSMVNKNRVSSENPKNFKKDLNHSGTKKTIDVQKELQWKDQQTDVPNDPQKLGMDIEKASLKTTKGEALKNVGNSTNEKGDEIPKHNFTDDEQKEVDLHRLGQQDLVYDNEPSKEFEERMKKDMGEELYKQRQEKLKFRGEAPMYNKDTQPMGDGIDKAQFDKEKEGWANRYGIKETFITGRYRDPLNKTHMVDFKVNDVQEINEGFEDLMKLHFTGLGNKYHGKTENKKVVINEGVENMINENEFFTDGKNIFIRPIPKEKMNENAETKNVEVNEHYNKMKHLLGYEPKSFVDTTNIKKNRKF